MALLLNLKGEINQGLFAGRELSLATGELLQIKYTLLAGVEQVLEVKRFRYRITSDNPVVIRLMPGMMRKVNFEVK